MALGDTYATLIEAKKYVNATGDSKDAVIQDALNSASREVENHCNRQFNLADAPSARIYLDDKRSSVRSDQVDVDDFATDEGLVVKYGTPGNLSTVEDYRLLPTNGIENGVPGWPYRSIRFPNSIFLYRDQIVEITARWGWPSVPAPVKQACLILTAANFKRMDAPLGIAGFNQYGPVRVRENAQVYQYLCDYVRMPYLVG